jgi:cytochrome c
MFDTMTVTKVVGSLCGALLFFLLGNWVAEALYSTGGHGAGQEAAYVIETDEEPAATETAAEAVPFAELVAQADPAAGEKLFSKCRACHKLEPGANLTGPTLFGVVGRPVASVDGFAYSAALVEHGGEWTPEQLDPWLENPRADIPGNKMSFAGLKSAEDRAALVAYLATIQ